MRALEPIPGTAQPKSKCEKRWTLPSATRTREYLNSNMPQLPVKNS